MGSSKINRLSLNRCPPYTEIFSKRRKIYSVCVESLSMPPHLIWNNPDESWIQIRFAGAAMPRCRSIFGLRWRCNRPKSAGKWQFVVTRHVQLCLLWFSLAPPTLGDEHLSNGGWIGMAASAVKRFPPAETFYCGNWHKRAGMVTRMYVCRHHNFEPMQFLRTTLNLSIIIKHLKAQQTLQEYVHSKAHLILVLSVSPNCPDSASLLGLLAKIKV